MTKRGKTAIVAVGGNALIIDDQHQSIPDQSKAAAISSRYVADMVEAGVTVILTHGNGPQVGSSCADPESRRARCRRCLSTMPTRTRRAPSVTCSSARCITSSNVVV